MFKKTDEKDKVQPFAPDLGESAADFGGGPPAVIGGSLTVEGTIMGKENLLVEGTVKGDINLQQNVVTVGSGGLVKARIHAAVIVVEGRVEGDLLGEEQIEIRRSGHVLGNIVAPRVGLEDGAQFKGNIDMNPKPAATPIAPATPAKPNVAKDDKIAGQNSDKKFSG
jgi:cytoskeletal protein CcmA (bactofilin family)